MSPVTAAIPTTIVAATILNIDDPVEDSMDY
jgi:hypothetical protein